MPVNQIVIPKKLSGRNTRIRVIFSTFYLLLFLTKNSLGQPKIESDSVQTFTLSQCVDYALLHQPLVNQAILNQQIAHLTNGIALSGWLPQVNLSANFTHYLSLPTAFIKNSSGQVIEQKTGVINTAPSIFSVTQTLFTPSLLYAARSAKLYIEEAEQISDSTKINTVANVSKTFYSLLLTLAQINTFKEDTARLAKTL
ncbi:MAG TPA: TolC family protein, partial [Puia sp.]|nr:TolC family protein [Puia sp.]